MKNKIASVLTSLSVAVGASQSNPAATLTISDGVNPPITINDNGGTDRNASPGAVVVQTNVGVWSLVVCSGASKPALGGPTAPVMDVTLQAIASVAGTLTVTFSDNGFDSGPGILNATVSTHLTYGINGTVGQAVYGDADNTLGAFSTLLTSTGPSAMPAVTNAFSPLSFTSPYSLTQVIVLRANGTSVLSLDASLAAAGSPRPPVGPGDTATTGFWRSKKCRGFILGMPNQPALGNWLAGNFPCRFGRFAGQANSVVAAALIDSFNARGQMTYAEVLAAAVTCFATDPSLAGNYAARYGFNLTPGGTGAKTFNVGPFGAVLGLGNNTSHTVLQLLQTADENCPPSPAAASALLALFDRINQTGGLK
jgi:hypothetical protein